jgi:hypothetical protein
VTVTLNATTGFTSAITLACTNVAQVVCSFSSPSAQLSGGMSTSVALSLTTGSYAKLTPTNSSLSETLPELAALLPIGILIGLRRNGQRPRLMIVLIALLLLIPLGSCSSGSTVSGNGGSGNQPNNYSVTVTATATGTQVVHTLGTLNVIVNR